MSLHHRNVHWSEAPRRELLRLAWPIAVSMVSYSVMTLTGTLFVSRLGPAALAGVGLGGTAAFLVVVFTFGLLRGVKVLVSQARGAGNLAAAHAQVATGVVTGAVLGALGTIAALLIALVLPRFAESAEAGAAAATYVAWRGLGSPFVLVFVALREARYGFGDSRSPMIAVVASNVVNIALDALFILVLHTGVEGAAWSTIVAHAVECAILLWPALRRGLPWHHVRLAEVRRLLSVGIPTGVQFVLEMGSFALLTLCLARIGDVQVAAHQIALQVIQFSFLPAVAIAEAASVMAGQAIGARRRELVLGVATQAAVIVALFCGACTLVLVGGGDLIAKAFTADATLASLTARLLAIAALFQICDGLQVVARGVLRGTGDVTTPAVIAVTTSWLCVPPTTILLGMVLGWGAQGGWIGLTVDILVATVILWRRLIGRRWLFAARRMQLAPAFSE